MKNFEDFYNEVRDTFPTMKELEIWEKYDWSLNGHENSFIMSELSIEMGSWFGKKKEKEVQKMMDIIEKYFHEGDVHVTSMIYTDYLVTIMEMRKEPREKIKTMMGAETRRSYIKLLDFYRESDI